MTNLKELFTDMNDELANKIGAVIADELMMQRSKEHPDRWETAGGTFTNIGLARRTARIFIEVSEKHSK